MGNRMEYLRKQKEGDYSLVKFLAVVIAILFLFMLATGGGLRWTVSIVILVLIGFLFFKRLHEKTFPILEWHRENELAETVNFQLPETHKLVNKAKGGSDWSRALLEKRLRQEFLKKVRRERNIGDKKVKELLNEPEEFKDIIGDKLLAEFIIKSRNFYKKVNKEDFANERDIEEVQHWIEDSKYENYLKRIIERMEEWN